MLREERQNRKKRKKYDNSTETVQSKDFVYRKYRLWHQSFKKQTTAQK
jgi:hypothetical protein